GDSVLVSIDARDGVVATDGWRQSTDLQAEELLRRLAALGVRRFAYTDIGRDGTLGSPNFEAVETMVAATDAPIIAAGGVAEVAHVVRLAELGAEGVIVGMALSDGRLRLPEALAAVR
ncbi:MAG: 1-(5-phosphoribosyl)-5-((5-phosphoribosylamino)methylideneamino)imidazole-4-carboxamide isomerase, partial [Chloroflexi bacterium]|nr:1-(5-phosphoribosyl)-5-((5-phosphoribosylamino)methylideneamino)imidazole-4-carboxamide isomerase [Chloroflexota bacterium]